MLHIDRDLPAGRQAYKSATQWGMSYGNDQSLKDNFIRPEVNIQLDIKAAN